jgi:hypothetical protein
MTCQGEIISRLGATKSEGDYMGDKAHILPQTWPNLTDLFEPMHNLIDSLSVHPVAAGQKVLIHFTNDYGVEMFKYPNADFFEMTVIKFSEKGKDHYEFAVDTSVPELSLGYTDEDIFRLCEQVSRLR